MHSAISQFNFTAEGAKGAKHEMNLVANSFAISASFCG
jgi:hypothetical protein